ncbi:MAG: LCP family protein [Oscillospiraceae bacterium]|nr:LCP family protein [Oscillospiraceae bacterium]
MSKGGRYLQQKPAASPKKKAVMIVLICVVALLVVGIGAGVFYYDYVLGLVGQAQYVEKNPSDEDIAAILGAGYLNSNGKVPTAPSGETEATEPAVTEPYDPDLTKTGKIINIMLVGQAYRVGEESRMADSMILATLNVETKTLTLTSFLRDMYIKLPNYKGHTCGHNKINTCYALGYAWGDTKGAMEMLDKLMLEQFGVNVDYNVEVDFTAFQEVINALGGIEVELTEAEAEYLTGLNYSDTKREFEAGTVTLDGEAALNYARMRKSSADDNDFKRASRQRSVITKVLEECKTMSLTQLNDMLTKILPMIITDMPKDVITTYALELLPIIADLQIVSNQCPAEGTYSSQIIEIYDVAQGCIMPNVAKNRELLMAIAEADILEAAETTAPTE